jgi:hypothetical protein
MIGKIPDSMDISKEWHKLDRQLSQIEELASYRGEMEKEFTRALHAAEDFYHDKLEEDDSKSVCKLYDLVDQVVKLVPKMVAKTKKKEEEIKKASLPKDDRDQAMDALGDTRNWLTKVEKDAKEFRGRVDKAIGEADALKKRSDKIWAVAGKIPQSADGGAQMIYMVQLVEQATDELDMSAFKNVKEVAKVFDGSMSRLADLRRAIATIKNTADLEKQQDLFDKFQANRDKLVDDMQRLEADSDKWKAAISKMSSKFTYDKALQKVLVRVTGLCGHFRVQVQGFFDQECKMRKLEELVGKQIEEKEEEEQERAYAVTELVEA